ncbi:MAG: PEP-CTERM sorting domain-containing protein [Terrimicrobiaceae bacterium]
MKTKNPHPHLLALALLALSSPLAPAAYVNFTGLTNSGGSFSTDVDGGTIPTVTVSALGGTGNLISQSAGTPVSAGFPAGSLFRLQDETPAVPSTDTMVTSLTFATISNFTIVAAPTNSNLNTSGDVSVSFRALKAELTGFSWTLTGLTNGTYALSGTNNEIITFTPTITGTPYTAFHLTPNFALDGVQVTSTSKSVSPYNSLQFAVDVVPEPGTWALIAASGMFLVIFRRRRSC